MATAALGCAALLASACNPVILGPNAAPEVLGISIPIPPPSLTEAPIVEVEIEGQLPDADPPEGTLVYLYEHGTQKGHFVFADGDKFTFTEVVLDLTDNCVQIYSDEPGPDGESIDAFFVFAIDPDDDQSIVIDQQNSGACAQGSDNIP